MTIKQELHHIVGYDSPEQVEKLKALLKRVFEHGAQLQKDRCATVYEEQQCNFSYKVKMLIRDTPTPQLFFNENI